MGPKLIGRQCVVAVLNYDHQSNIDGIRNAMHASLYKDTSHWFNVYGRPIKEVVTGACSVTGVLRNVLQYIDVFYTLGEYIYLRK